MKLKKTFILLIIFVLVFQSNTYANIRIDADNQNQLIIDITNGYYENGRYYLSVDDNVTSNYYVGFYKMGYVIPGKGKGGSDLFIEFGENMILDTDIYSNLINIEYIPKCLMFNDTIVYTDYNPFENEYDVPFIYDGENIIVKVKKSEENEKLEIAEIEDYKGNKVDIPKGAKITPIYKYKDNGEETYFSADELVNYQILKLDEIKYDDNLNITMGLYDKDDYAIKLEVITNDNKLVISKPIMLMDEVVSSNTIATTNSDNDNQDSNATYYEQAVKLSKINVLKGNANGYELDRQPTRLEGLIMLIRLLGKESEVEAYKDEVSNFNDVPDWGKAYVNYAYKMGLTKGVSSEKFGSNDIISAASYMTFMLRSLNYDDSKGDFVWSESIDKAKEISLIDDSVYNELLTKTFSRNQVAMISYNTLLTKLKESDQTLAEQLVDNGTIERQTALEIGLIADDYTYLLNNVTGVVADGSLAEPFELEDSEIILYAIYEKQSDIDKFLDLTEDNQKKLLYDIAVNQFGNQLDNKTIYIKVIFDSNQYATMDVISGQDYLKSNFVVLPKGEKTIVITQLINNEGGNEFTYYYKHSFPKLLSDETKLMFKNSSIGSNIDDVEKDNLDIYQIVKKDNELWYIETVNNTDFYLIYYFENGKLSGVDYHIANVLNKDNCFDTFKKFKEILDKYYNSTGEINQLWKNEQYKNDSDNWNTAIELGQMYYSSSWNLGDCNLDLVLISLGDGNINLMLINRPN